MTTVAEEYKDAVGKILPVLEMCFGTKTEPRSADWNDFLDAMERIKKVFDTLDARKRFTMMGTSAMEDRTKRSWPSSRRRQGTFSRVGFFACYLSAFFLYALLFVSLGVFVCSHGLRLRTVFWYGRHLTESARVGFGFGSCRFPMSFPLRFKTFPSPFFYVLCLSVWVASSGVG